MKENRTERYILEKRQQDGALFFSVIDPVDYRSVDDAIASAKKTADAGADIVLIGGSVGAHGDLLDTVVKRTKELVSVPVVIFPGNIATISRYADALYFMSMLNSRQPYWITLAQTLAAPTVRALPIEPLSVGYIVVEPGGTVGWVGDANKIPRNKPQLAAAMALAGEYMGSRFILTDVGSAAPEPVPLEMVAAVRKAISRFYIVAGGIRTEKQARNIIRAGADAIQVGTAVEQAKDVEKQIGRLVHACKEEGKKRI